MIHECLKNFKNISCKHPIQKYFMMSFSIPTSFRELLVTFLGHLLGNQAWVISMDLGMHTSFHFLNLVMSQNRFTIFNFGIFPFHSRARRCRVHILGYAYRLFQSAHFFSVYFTPLLLLMPKSKRLWMWTKKSYWVWDSEAKKSLINHDMVVDEDHVENLPYIAMDSLRMDPYVNAITWRWRKCTIQPIGLLRVKIHMM